MPDFNRIDAFNYHLPPERIAKMPLANRTASRLLQCDVATQTMIDGQFTDLIEHLQAGDVLVLNDTKVIPARFFGQKESGGKIEGLVERIVDTTHALVHIKSSKSPKPGATLLLEGDYQALVIERQDDLFLLALGKADGGEASWLDFTDRYGHMPLPPYIDRADQPEDRERYQCVFHNPDAPGAVAAPTAGLHIDDAFLAAVKAKGVKVVTVTLHVGAGTFQPVRVDHLDDHIMHSEWCTVPQATVDIINETKQKQTGRIVAVGTTSVRTLESAVDASGALARFEGPTNLFIRPGFQLRIVDALVTNFHLPKSTLLVLICTMGGYEFMMRAYHHAIDEKYRFFSYGDAMFIDASRSK